MKWQIKCNGKVAICPKCKCQIWYDEFWNNALPDYCPDCDEELEIEEE